MAIYEYRCRVCNQEKEILGNDIPTCECGGVMEKLISLPAPAIVFVTGKDISYDTLNRDNGRDFPGGNKHRKRYEQAMLKGLDQRRPVIGRGF